MNNARNLDDNLTQALWQNTKVKTVVQNSTNSKVTKNGHGPFVEFDDQSYLFDFRLGKERPFLGHNHPLLLQYHFGRLSKNNISNFSTISQESFNKLIKQYQKVSFGHPDLLQTDDNLLMTFNEESILKQAQNKDFILKRLRTLSQDRSIIILEDNLMGLNESALFYFNELTSCRNIIIVAKSTISSTYLIASSLKYESTPDIVLFSAINDYLNNIISSAVEGKNKVDFAIIDSKLDELCAKRYGRYLLFQKKLKPRSLRENGIIISDLENLDGSILSIPIACTNQELLDSLDRISKSL